MQLTVKHDASDLLRESLDSMSGPVIENTTERFTL